MVVVQFRRCKRHVFLFCLAFLLRFILYLGALSTPERFTRPDTASYYNTAINLVKNGVFSSNLHAPYVPEINRTPGFPLLLALIVRLFGPGLAKIVFFLILIDCCVPLLLFEIGRMWQNEKLGFVCGLLYAVDLLSIVTAELVLSDSFFVFLLCLKLYFLTRFILWEKKRDLAICAILLAMMTLTRPISLLWFIPFAFLLLIDLRRSFVKRIGYTLLMICLFFAVLFPWMLRNYYQGGGLRLSTNTSYTLYYHNAAALMAKRTGVSAEVYRQQWLSETEEEFAAHPELYPNEDARYRYRMQKAKDIIRSDRPLYVALHLQPYILAPAVDAFMQLLGQTSGGKGTLDVLNRKGPLQALLYYFEGKWGLLLTAIPFVLVLLGEYGLCVYAGILLFVKKRYFELLLFFSLSLYYLLIPGPITLSRYRAPATPAILLLASLGLLSILDKIRVRIKKDPIPKLAAGI
jgi:4-amino-4-deoxy-L-arabinose transferase-like glycosyltransferase